MDNFV
jgi:alpha-tubulin suppressor-like RCC1 family protein